MCTEANRSTLVTVNQCLAVGKQGTKSLLESLLIYRNMSEEIMIRSCVSSTAFTGQEEQEAVSVGGAVAQHMYVDGYPLLIYLICFAFCSLQVLCINRN